MNVNLLKYHDRIVLPGSDILLEVQSMLLLFKMKILILLVDYRHKITGSFFENVKVSLK